MNWIAIIVCAILGHGLGALWYSPLAFGNKWMKLMGYTKKDMEKAMKDGMGKTYATSFAGTLVSVIAFAYIFGAMGVSGIQPAIQNAVILWGGFIATVLLGDVLWKGHTWTLYSINASYKLVEFLIYGLILALWI